VPHEVLFAPLSFTQRAFITNLFFGLGLATVYAGRLFSRRAVVWSGAGMFLMALFRVFWFDILTQNPRFTGAPIGEAYFVNGLALAYLAPIAWLWIEERPQLRIVTMTSRMRGALTLILGFVFVSLTVRNIFHGSDLLHGDTSDAENFTYSAIWLAMGAGLLLAGTLKKDRPLRVASLVVIMFTIVKVFIYDASTLTGLYRVFSFLGLGLSLLSLSWFYSRFVFNSPKELKKE
jgi:uncharacterized membrane protein